MFNFLMTINAAPSFLATRNFVTWLYPLSKWHYTILPVTDPLLTFSQFSFQFLPCLYSMDDCVGLAHALKLEDESSRVENNTKMNAFCFTAIQSAVILLQKLCRYLTTRTTIILCWHAHVQQVTGPGTALIVFILFYFCFIFLLLFFFFLIKECQKSPRRRWILQR